MKINRKDRQTLADLAIQYCGDLSAVFEIADLNNISLTDENSVDVDIPDANNARVVNFYRNSGIYPASSDDGDYSLGTIGDEDIVGIAGDDLEIM